MIYRIAFLMLMGIATVNAMERPRGLEMRRDSRSLRPLKVSHKEPDSECDCLDVIKRGEYLLRQHQVTESQNPLRRKNHVHCCGECCEITSDCAGSTVVLCAPQSCLCAALYLTMHTVGQACCSCAPSWQGIVLASLGGTVCISSCVSVRNNMLKHEQKDS